MSTIITPYLAWHHPEQWLDVTPPLTSGSYHRTPALLDQVLDQFDVEHAQRYLPSGRITWCNLYASDVTRAAGCPLPRVLLVGPAWQELSANRLWEWLTGECVELPRAYRHSAAQAGWRLATREAAEAEARAGRVAVAVAHNAVGSGHIAIFRPGGGIAQAGAANRARCTLEEGFGHLARSARFVSHP